MTSYKYNPSALVKCRKNIGGFRKEETYIVEHCVNDEYFVYSRTGSSKGKITRTELQNNFAPGKKEEPIPLTFAGENWDSFSFQKKLERVLQSALSEMGGQHD